MNDAHVEINIKASMLLSLLCRHTSDYKGFIDVYWGHALRQLDKVEFSFIQNLAMSIDGIPPPSLLYLLDVIMTHTQQGYYPRIIGVVFAAVRALQASHSLTEERIKDIMPFFFSLPCRSIWRR